MAHDVFISYAAEDKPTADAVCATLEAQHVRCWIAPRDVLPGRPYAEMLVEAIHNARVLVLVFSSKSNASPHVMREVERAVTSGIVIVPFRIEDVAPSKSMEYFIGGTHWLDALTPPVERHLQHLAGTVGLLLGGMGADSHTEESQKGLVSPLVADAPAASGWEPARGPESGDTASVIAEPAAKPKKSWMRSAWAIAGAALVVLCALGLGVYYGTRSPETAATRTPTSTSTNRYSTGTSAVTTNTTAGNTGLTAYSDDFSAPFWNTEMARYDNGRYLLSADRDGSLNLAPGCMMDNGVVSVEAELSFQDSASYAYGIAARASSGDDVDRWYEFLITSSGCAQIWLIQGDNGTPLASDWLPADIQPATGKNDLTASLAGGSLTLSVNGIQVVSTTNQSLASGMVGLIVQADTGPITVAFDNLRVTDER